MGDLDRLSHSLLDARFIAQSLDNKYFQLYLSFFSFPFLFLGMMDDCQ